MRPQRIVTRPTHHPSAPGPVHPGLRGVNSRRRCPFGLNPFEVLPVPMHGFMKILWTPLGYASVAERCHCEPLDSRSAEASPGTDRNAVALHSPGSAEPRSGQRHPGNPWHRTMAVESIRIHQRGTWPRPESPAVVFAAHPRERQLVAPRQGLFRVRRMRGAPGLYSVGRFADCTSLPREEKNGECSWLRSGRASPKVLSPLHDGCPHFESPTGPLRERRHHIHGSQHSARRALDPTTDSGQFKIHLDSSTRCRRMPFVYRL